MKELYTSPEMKLVCFEANEKLANISWDDLHNKTGDESTNKPGSGATGGGILDL